MRVLRTVIEIPMLAMFNARQELPLGGPVAFELIGDEHPWDILTAFEELAEKLLRGLFVPTALDENVEDITVLIHRPPEIMPLLVDRDEHLVQMPFIARPGAPVTQLIGVCLAKLPTPLAD